MKIILLFWRSEYLLVRGFVFWTVLHVVYLFFVSVYTFAVVGVEFAQIVQIVYKNTTQRLLYSATSQNCMFVFVGLNAPIKTDNLQAERAITLNRLSDHNEINF